jgi:branched-chain amino acid transport system substrate-binding protein
LCFDAVNKAGGVNGSRLELLVLDDGFDPARSAENCRQLVNERDVIALFANPGTAQVVAALPIAQKAGAPLFGPVTGSSALRKQKLQEVFYVRASFRDELQHIVDHTRTVGIQRIALFHTDDALGKSVREELQEILSAGGAKLAAVAGVAFRDGSIAQAAKDIWRQQPQAIVLGAAGANFGRFAAAYRALGGTAPQMYGLSVVDPGALGDDATGAARGVVLTQIMPSTRNTILPVVREYREALARGRAGAGFVRQREDPRRRPAPRGPRRHPRRPDLRAREPRALRHRRLRGHLHPRQPQWLDLRRHGHRGCERQAAVLS